MATTDRSLDDLRREIDRIDDAIHDLLMERVAVTQRIGALKTRHDVPSYRPGREAAILRRLVGRHQGPLPPETLIRIWREVIAGLTRLQGPFAVAVYAPAGGQPYQDLARDHFSALTPIAEHSSTAQVIAAVVSAAATVGVLPMPDESATEAWWHNLGGENGTAPRIVTRLPFRRQHPGRAERLEALVIATLPAEPTGQDRSYLLIEGEAELSRARLKAGLAAAGLDAVSYVVRGEGPNPRSWRHLVEVEGHVPAGDQRLPEVLRRLGEGANFIEILGSYPIPLDPAAVIASAQLPSSALSQE